MANDEFLERPGRLARSMTLVLHTSRAQYLLTGRKSAAGVRGYPGVMAFASGCYRLWVLTGYDNPYADHALIDVIEGIDRIQADIDKEAARLAAILVERQSRGIIYAIGESDKPLRVEGISFGSPYGYLACELLASIDYLLRLIMTHQDVGLLGTANARALTYSYLHRYRSLIAQTIKRADTLAAEPLRLLCRRDFAADAAPDAKARAALAAESAGDLPEDILAGARRPEHLRPVRGAVSPVRTA